MGAEDDRMGFTQFFNEIAYFNDLDRVKTDGGFVQNDDLWLSQKCLCDPDSLAITLGERANQPITHILNARALHGAVDLLPKLFSAQPLCLAYKGQILLRCLVWIQRRLLWEIADQLFGRLRLLQNVKAADLHGAVCRGKASRHNVHRG